MGGIPIKPMVYLGIVVAVLGCAKWAHGTIYQSGYDSARIEFQNLAIEQQNTAIENARRQWEADQEAAEVQIVVEEKIVEKVKVVREEIPKVVERIVTVTPECSDLGFDFVGVFNAAIVAANGGEAGSPDSESSIN